MKIKINRNILWTEAFANELAEIGVKYACISPGSRNTPLTLAFANNNKIKSFVHIDERSCAFFALGIAKASGKPVVVICTSGTATAELYPAIIEAYQQRVPLIICTADRPPELLHRGANQTINQRNLYKNHIRWFADAGLPEPTTDGINHIKQIAGKAVFESSVRSRGPVHLNFPFRKPFEPDSFTDEVNQGLVEQSHSNVLNKNDFQPQQENSFDKDKWFTELFNKVKSCRKGVIIAGPENYNLLFPAYCQELACILGYPILADGASQMRFGTHRKANIISNFEGFLRSDTFTDVYKPDLILHFGRTITSKALDEYLKKCNGERFMINEFGDWFDPSGKAAASIACKPYLFCRKMLDMIQENKFEIPENGWVNAFKTADDISACYKKELIHKAKFPNESRVIYELLHLLPEKSNIMISNSMPIRDFDYFASINSKNITVYNNRGASGIDGITSTALGIAAVKTEPTVLITGDLAFYYDLNGLLAAGKYDIPIIIILLNNNGGGIFEVLPIAEYGKTFKEYFIAPHNLDFSHFVKAYKGTYYNIISWEHFRKSFKSVMAKKGLFVLEIKTNAVKSLKIRRKLWSQIDSGLKNNFPL